MKAFNIQKKEYNNKIKFKKKEPTTSRGGNRRR